VAVLVLIGGFLYGFACSESRLAPYPQLRSIIDWSRTRPWLRSAFYFLSGREVDRVDRIRGSWQPLAGARGGQSGETEMTRAELQAVGYLSGYRPATELKGVTVNMDGLAFDGLNFVVSGHAAEARLMDMNGKILHSWAYEFGEAFPEFRDVDGRYQVNPFYRNFWRRAYLYPNGDLLAIYEGFGMIKLDRDSNLIWAISGGCHHDIDVTEDGSIYVLTREPRMLPRYDEDRHVLEDFITVLSPGGEILRKVSLLKAFERSSFASYLDARLPVPDILHTNTVQVLDGSRIDRSGAFGEGNVLISPRNINVIAVVDMEEEKVVWALSGQWVNQHEPTLLPGGNILLFDNKGHDRMSKVIEFDPLTQKIHWAYEGTPENGFYTESSGTAYRLPNGNTLIVESNAGRAFEVTGEKRIVWEYYNPERAGEDDQLIATLFDLVRLPPDFPLDWLAAP
jgi:hypothetical protein